VIDSGRDAIVKNAGTDNEVTTFPVWVTLENPPEKVLSGMSAQVSISTETRKERDRGAHPGGDRASARGAAGDSVGGRRQHQDRRAGRALGAHRQPEEQARQGRLRPQGRQGDQAQGDHRPVVGLAGRESSRA
jgi:hypothetical protein